MKSICSADNELSSSRIRDVSFLCGINARYDSDGLRQALWIEGDSYKFRSRVLVHGPHFHIGVGLAFQYEPKRSALVAINGTGKSFHNITPEKKAL